jgi:hypothetical protein
MSVYEAIALTASKFTGCRNTAIDPSFVRTIATKKKKRRPDGVTDS